MIKIAVGRLYDQSNPTYGVAIMTKDKTHTLKIKDDGCFPPFCAQIMAKETIHNLIQFLQDSVKDE